MLVGCIEVNPPRGSATIGNICSALKDRLAANTTPFSVCGVVDLTVGEGG
jgi:hypothetical protein